MLFRSVLELHLPLMLLPLWIYYHWLAGTRTESRTRNGAGTRRDANASSNYPTLIACPLQQALERAPTYASISDG